MPGRHHQKSFTSRHRYPLVLTAVALLIAAAGLLAATRNRYDPATPLVVTPALPAVTASPAPVAGSVAPAPSPSASASPFASRPATRAPVAARAPSRPPSPTPAAAGGSFAARYILMDSRRSSFEASISVINEGRAARNWEVVVTHDPDDGVRLYASVGASAARPSAAGNTVTFTGGPLAPGDSVTISYLARKRTDDVAEPTSCRVGGVECRVTVGRSGR